MTPFSLYSKKPKTKTRIKMKKLIIFLLAILPFVGFSQKWQVECNSCEVEQVKTCSSCPASKDKYVFKDGVTIGDYFMQAPFKIFVANNRSKSIRIVDFTGIDRTFYLSRTIYSDLTSFQNVIIGCISACSGGGGGSDNQTISLVGTNLSIQNGNTVDLSVVQDGVNDADFNPTNEIQSLSFNTGTNILSLSAANTVDLSTLAGGGGATNLSYTASPTQGLVVSDTGTDAVIPLATTTNAGLFDPVDKSKIDFLSVTGAINLDNAIQTLSFNTGTNILTISNGNTVDLSTLAGGGGGATNLSYTASPTQGVVTSDTGTDATLPLATTTNAGLLDPTDKTKIDDLVAFSDQTISVTGGTSTINYYGEAGVTAALSSGHITITIPSGIARPIDLAVIVTPADMTYTDGVFYHLERNTSNY